MGMKSCLWLIGMFRLLLPSGTGIAWHSIMLGAGAVYSWNRSVLDQLSSECSLETHVEAEGDGSDLGFA